MDVVIHLKVPYVRIHAKNKQWAASPERPINCFTLYYPYMPVIRAAVSLVSCAASQTTMGVLVFALLAHAQALDRQVKEKLGSLQCWYYKTRGVWAS